MYKMDVSKKILNANEQYALKNSQILAKHEIVCLNMISSPGSGKTTILTRTIRELRDKIKIGVIEGDIQTDIDAQKIKAACAQVVVQINTYGACHLSAAQISQVLEKLPLFQLDLIFIENVGNLVCPSAFQLGEWGKIAVLSVTEGDDKPAKYPALFAQSKVLLVNKMDLLEATGKVDFDLERVRTDAQKLNKNMKIFPISAKTGKGMSCWYDWLLGLVKR